MLGRDCASTAMIYAMHQTKVACLVRHGRGSAWHQRLLRRLCAEQLLLASSTTEGQSRRRCSQQLGADRVARFAHHARAPGDGHLLRRGRRRHRHHRAAFSGSGKLGPGSRRLPQRRLRAQAAERLGRVRHARHLQRRFHARRLGFRRADPAGELRQDSRPDHDAVRASGLERRLGRHRRGGGRSRARLRAQGRARRRRHAAARRPAPDPRQCHAADAAQPHRRGAATLRGGVGRSGGARIHRLPDRHEHAEGECVGARGRDRHERDAGLRACGLSQRQRIQHRPPSARHPVVADHDQQRPDPGQYRERRRCWAARRHRCATEFVGNYEKQPYREA